MLTKRFARASHRACALLLAACLTLTGCAAGAVADDPSLSPEENQLRKANARFTQTVGEGAAVGAIAGGLAGALLGGRNRVAMAALGATAGGALGAGAGFLVARNNAARTHSEADYNTAIDQAQQDAAAYRTSADAARGIASNCVAQINALDRQYRARQITAAQFRASVAHYQKDNELLQAQVTGAQDTANSLRTMGATGNTAGSANSTAADIDGSRQSLASSAAAISQALSRVPQGA